MYPNVHNDGVIRVFPSTNRSNLDPWGQYSDEQIWDALERTHIKEMVGRMKRPKLIYQKK